MTTVITAFLTVVANGIHVVAALSPEVMCWFVGYDPKIPESLRKNID